MLHTGSVVCYTSDVDALREVGWPDMVAVETCIEEVVLIVVRDANLENMRVEETSYIDALHRYFLIRWLFY